MTLAFSLFIDYVAHFHFYIFKFVELFVNVSCFVWNFLIYLISDISELSVCIVHVCVLFVIWYI